MYLLIAEKKELAKAVIKQICREKRLQLEGECFDFGEVEEHDFIYVLELGRSVLPPDSAKRECMEYQRLLAYKYRKKAENIFLIRENCYKKLR